MTDRYEDVIMRHVRHRAYDPQSARELENALNINADDAKAFEQALGQLLADGQIVRGNDATIALPPLGREVTGKIKVNDRGFGFIITDEPNEHGDLFVPPDAIMGALTGDRVRAEVIRRSGWRAAGHSPYTGKVVEILQRGTSHFVGKLSKRGKTWIVVPDGTSMTDPIIVRDPQAKNAKLDDKVVVELTKYPEGNMVAEGVITEVLGDAGRPDVETVAICRAYGLADKFPENALNEARAAVRDFDRNPEKYYEGRTDLRDLYTVTIDPPDAKDYDDAISLEVTDRGVELGVHIADVATFVRPGTPLDDEAYLRGNSTYLPRLVVPMLPEVLSNGLCSLQPGVPRLARSAFITYDDRGKVIATRFASSVIQSDHRMTYLEAQALIDGDEKEARKHAKYDEPYTKQLIDKVRAMDKLAKVIRKRRLDAGMIVLDLPECVLVYDEDGHVIDAEPEDDAFTHKIIEAFMVEANEAVARVFADLDVPLIRRVHPDPGAHDTEQLRVFARVAGYNVPQNPSRKELQTLIDSVRGKPAARAVHFAVLRTLTKAEYSPQIIGHFALASEHYTHFTSPIRRYPDLAVHRAFDALLDVMKGQDELSGDPHKRKKLAAKLREDERVLTEEELYKLGGHCSSTERNSEAAERELRNFLVLQLLEKHVGDEFPGTVTGVTGSGLFVQIDKFVVEGMIRLPDLPGGPAERWKLNKFTGSLVAQRSGRSITIGDRFKVRIAAVDLTRREMDLLIIEETGNKRRDKHATHTRGGVAEKGRRKPKTKHAVSRQKRKGGGKRRRKR